jgi:dihydrofolate synthase/folylpolyglutamate synthase
VTEFEVATAATFLALATAGVEVGVIEAGLGGRLDATNVIPSQVTVLTSVGLDHTEWLGETELEIAAEKLAVLRDGTTLVLGRLSVDVAELAARTAAERGARLIQAPEDPGATITVRAAGRFQRRNFALAAAATEAFLGEFDEAALRRVGAELVIPGRMEQVAEDPPTLFDAAHNPDGIAALVEALPEVVGERPVFACVAILADKDAEGILRRLGPACERIVCTEVPQAALATAGRPGARSRSAAELAALGERAGPQTEAIADPVVALGRARELAAERQGVALATGSHYLLGSLWTGRHAQSFSR